MFLFAFAFFLYEMRYDILSYETGYSHTLISKRKLEKALKSQA
jgi:hypothetical protein